MGDRKRRKAQFLKDHPWCCFCGGGEPSTTEDHVPPRSAFLGRNWPVGFVFPACEKCNHGSSSEDRLFAFATLIQSTRPTPEQSNQWSALLAEIDRDYPDLRRRMLPSANEKRRYLKAIGHTPTPGQAYGNVPILAFPQEIQDAIDAVLNKLARALHYKYSGRIVPAEGHVFVSAFGTQEAGLRLDREILSLFRDRAEMRRNGDDLSGQFGCRYQVSDDGNLGSYLCKFRTSVMAVMLVSLVDPIEDVALTSEEAVPVRQSVA